MCTKLLIFASLSLFTASLPQPPTLPPDYQASAPLRIYNSPPHQLSSISDASASSSLTLAHRRLSSCPITHETEDTDIESCLSVEPLEEDSTPKSQSSSLRTLTWHEDVVDNAKRYTVGPIAKIEHQLIILSALTSYLSDVQFTLDRQSAYLTSLQHATFGATQRWNAFYYSYVNPHPRSAILNLRAARDKIMSRIDVFSEYSTMFLHEMDNAVLLLEKRESESADDRELCLNNLSLTMHAWNKIRV